MAPKNADGFAQDVTTTMVPGPGAIANVRIPHREDDDYPERWAEHEAYAIAWRETRERETTRPGRAP